MKKITIKNNTTATTRLSFLALPIITSSLLLTSCSQVSGLLKSDSDSSEEKESALVVPPTLRLPDAQAKSSQSASPIIAKKVAVRATNEALDNKDYYVVVGTYPDQNQALDTFVRLSSIGLPHAAMESRKTKSGRILHMVRLGPFHKQSEIDRVKDKLVSDGMSQFKVVVN